MYQNYMNKPSFMTNTANPSFGASTSSFGQPSANTSMFSSMQPSNIFQTPTASSFNTGPTAQSGFGTNLFGQQPQPSTSGLFGTSNAFGQNKSSFGFGSTPAQTGIFGQQPQQQPGTSLFQSNSAPLFGGSSFGNQQTTGTVVKFQPVTGADTMQKNGVTQSISTKHHCITCMKEYESKSLEELRFEDYSCNRKGPQQQTSFGGTTPFGANTTGASTSLFGQTENKQAFLQPQGFGQTSAFGQTTPAFGVTSQPNTSNLFGKPNTFGTTTSTTPTFGFNATTQSQPTFGGGVFTNRPNTTNLFQKPAQPTTGFNTGQGFSFNQTGTTQTSNVFQVSKPNTGFGMFGQTNTTPAFAQTTQPAFGTNFGKVAQPISFSQPTQPAFGANSLTCMQNPSVFAKPTNLFSNTTSGGGLFNNNMFQQTPSTFNLNMNQQQPTQFPPEQADDSKISFVASDTFPDGPHVYNLNPLASDNSATNPKDLKALLDGSKKRDEMMNSHPKIRTAVPKAKRGNNYNKEFFETSQVLRNSHKCLVIRKANENTTTIFNKYKNELIEEAAEATKGDREEDDTKIQEENIPHPVALTFSNTLDLREEETTIAESDIDVPSISAVSDPEVADNPAGVILTKPEYYMYPALEDLHQYMDENGDCVVQGLTIGRKGYGNVYFPDPINIANMNLDEIVHFRHRELIIYPDDNRKPPVGEGLNRRAQVTLDKIYPREKITNNYVTDVNHIIESNFVDNLMLVTQKHDCKFVDYRPKTGSWVFKVKHFSKYSFTDEDEKECEVQLKKVAAVKKSNEILKTIDEMEDIPSGLGGRLPKPSEPVQVETSLDFWPEDTMINEEMYHTDSAIQTLKSSLFTNLETIEPTPEKSVVKLRADGPCEVRTAPKVHQLPDISLLILPEKITTTQRIYTEMGIFKCNTFKVGWGKGFNFYNSDPIADSEVVYSLNHCNINVESSDYYNSMMPDLTSMLEVTLAQSEFSFDKNNIPTLHIKTDMSYLLKQTELFNDQVKTESLTGGEKYLCSVWNLCMALWGPGNNSICSRRQYLSDWLKTFAYDLSDDSNVRESFDMSESDAFKTIFKLLSFYKVAEACEFASKNKLNRLSLLISQMSANEELKERMQKFVGNFIWKEKNIVIEDFKKLYLVLAGVPVYENINTCADLDWMRSFGLHLWYMAPASAPIEVAFNLYKSAFTDMEYACKPVPPHCDSEFQTTEYDLLYHILAMYCDCTYQLCKVLHPETHTEDTMDYRLSWFLLQLFLSLKVGLVRDSEKEHLHTTFATQLENAGQWKWAIFTLLFVENNIIKKNLIMQILDRNLSPFAETGPIENELVRIFKIPPSWIHEVKATKTKATGHYYDYFQHYLYMGDVKRANGAFVEHILPELFVNEQFEYLRCFIKKMAPYAKSLVNWQNETGLVSEFLDMHDAHDEKVATIGGKLSSVIRRISCFPAKNDQQKLCVAELSRKCVLLFKLIYKNLESEVFQSKFIDVLDNTVMPMDMKHYELFYFISKFVQDESTKS